MHLEEVSISCSKLHSAILFTSYSCIQFIPFGIIISYRYLISLSNSHLYHSLSSILFLSRLYSSSPLTSLSIFSCVSSLRLNFYFSCRMMSSTTCWTIALFSYCLTNVLLVTVSWLDSLVGLHLAYLVKNSPKTLHLSD